MLLQVGGRNRGKVGAENAKHVGGIVGDMQNYAVVCGSYNTGSVTGADYLGGIAGEVYVASAPLGCYNTGDVGMAMHCGGALGSFGGTIYGIADRMFCRRNGEI